MTDLFAAYAQRAIPAAAQRRQEKAESALDKKLAEKQRLHKAYRRWRSQHIRDVLTREPRLTRFNAYLRTVQAGQAGELIEAIAESWLPRAAADVRLLALRMVDARCDRINRAAGFAPLDDPLPPQTSAYFQARALLHEGGRA